MGTSSPVTRVGGASSQSNASAITRATISAPTPDCGQPSSTVTTRSGLLHGLNDGRAVHRAQRAQIDHFGIDAELRQFLGRLQRIGHAHGKRDDGHVAYPGARLFALPIGSTKSSSLGTGKLCP